MVKADFDTQTGTLNTTFDGDVMLNEIVDYIRATKENDSYPRKLKILTDGTNANMNFTADDLNVIVEENLQSIERYDYIIDAIILDTPKEMALSMLYQEFSKTNKYLFKVFSSREAAVKWLAIKTPE